jgi:hypothetical protein
MAEISGFSYFYIDPQILLRQGYGCKDFLEENINSYISTISCMKELINSCIHNDEMDNLKHCLAKLKSSVAELKITSLSDKINDLIYSVEALVPKENLKVILKDFLLICELIVIDLNALKKNEGITE